MSDQKSKSPSFPENDASATLAAKKDFFSEIPNLHQDRKRVVAFTLEEDIGDGDITAQLIPSDQFSSATIITREDCIICGTDWVNEVFMQLDPALKVEWKVKDGEYVKANSELCQLNGNSRILLTGERTALNFLQLLSGTATASRRFADLVKGTEVKILDTRKTIPGLRSAQKYAVRCGGSYNHRIGLYDAFLIKENHIAACGGIAKAIMSARKQDPEKLIEVEVENLDELTQALDAKADVVMLDNFSDQDTKKAISMAGNLCSIEISGGVEQDAIKRLAQLGPTFISSGSLTKHCVAVDLSMRISS